MSVLRFYRVSDWLHFLGFTLLGVMLAGQLNAISPLHTIMITVASAGLLGYAYSFNDLHDRELADSHHENRDSATEHKTSYALFPALPLLGSLVLLSRLSLTLVVLGVSFSILWTMYSYPVPRLKAVPGVCTAVNGVGFPVLFLMGFVAGATPNLECILIFCALVLLEIPAQLIHEIWHASEDRLFRVRTTAIRYGEKRAIEGAVIGLLGALILVAFMLSQGILGLATPLALSLFASIFMIVLLLALTQKLVVDFGALRMQYKYAGIITGTVVAVSTFLHL